MNIDPELYQGKPTDIVIDPTTGRATERQYLPGYWAKKGAVGGDTKQGYVRADAKMSSILEPIIEYVNDHIAFLEGKEDGEKQFDSFADAVDYIIGEIETSGISKANMQQMVYTIKDIASPENIKRWRLRYKEKTAMGFKLGEWYELVKYLTNALLAKGGLRVKKAGPSGKPVKGDSYAQTGDAYKPINESQLKRMIRREVRRVVMESLR